MAYEMIDVQEIKLEEIQAGDYLKLKVTPAGYNYVTTAIVDSRNRIKINRKKIKVSSVTPGKKPSDIIITKAHRVTEKPIHPVNSETKIYKTNIFGKKTVKVNKNSAAIMEAARIAALQERIYWEKRIMAGDMLLDQWMEDAYQGSLIVAKQIEDFIKIHY